MIKIVTIEREFGCGGGEIASLLAKRLGWKLWDQLLTDEIAKLANCSREVIASREERNDPLYYRLFKSFVRGSYEGSMNVARLNLIDSETILRRTRTVVQQASQEGSCVIVGRGSQQMLKNRTDTLRVFLYAPKDYKVRRLMALGESETDANDLIDVVDRERGNFVEKYFGVEWPDRTVYQVMVNTAIGNKSVLRVIHDCMQLPEL